jgi:hypothetical protein
MDKELLKKVRRHVSTECANHVNRGPEGIQDYCWNREMTQNGICDYFLTEPKECTYFLSAVLPTNPELEEDVNENRRIDRGGSPVEVNEGVKTNPIGVQKSGIAVAKIGRKGILHRE